MPSIFDFKQAFNGGTRENRYIISGKFPTDVGGNISHFHVTATQIPTVSTLVMEYNYFGRKYYYPGEKQYGSWSIRILDDIDNSTGNARDMWKKFSDWQNLINGHTTNISATQNSYKTNDWKVQQLDLNGETPIKEFGLIGCWPKTIEPIVFNMANPNTLNQFAVVLIYDQITLKTGTTDITKTTPIS